MSAPSIDQADAAWREANRRYLDRADALAAEGDELGALLALSAYQRVEAVRVQERAARERAAARRRTP